MRLPLLVFCVLAAACVSSRSTLAEAAATAAGSLPPVSKDSVELSPSVNLVGKYDWEVIQTESGEAWSRCLDMVWRGVEAGSSRINFVPTHHWLPDETSPNGISSFCYMDTIAPASEATEGQNQYRCFPWSQAVIQEYTAAMTKCFAEAMRQGLTVYVRPHLDDGTLKGAWRNGLLLEPTVAYGEFSYMDIMLLPLADALREAAAITTKEESIKPPPGGTRPTVYFAMQGEMSATIMRFSSAWGGLVNPIRQRIAGSTTANSIAAVDVKIGVGLNFNRLDDTTSVTKQFGSSRLSWLAWQVGLEPPAGSRNGVPQIDEEGLRRLFTQQLDFLGISAYAPYNIAGRDLALREFENSAFMLCDEMLSAYDIDIRGMANSGQLELQYSEFGIGGGSGYAGGQTAQTPSEVALRPFFGVYGDYKIAKDPWSIPANAAFRKAFYYKALQWLADREVKTHNVASVFIWSTASWDVFGVYPESTNVQGSYRDPEILAAAAAYNKAVRAAKETAAGQKAAVDADSQGPAAPDSSTAVAVTRRAPAGPQSQGVRVRVGGVGVDVALPASG